MGKHPGSSEEELEFIFNCFARGLTSPTDVLEELQDTEFPLRNPRFIRERKKHFEAAKKVIGESIGNLLIVEAKRKHFEDLCDEIRLWIDVLNDEAWDTLMSYVDLDEYEPSTECVWHWGLPSFRRRTDSSLEVLFLFERGPLFEALKVHLADEELWKWWAEIKQALSKGIERGLREKHWSVGQIIVPQTTSDLVPKIVMQLEKWGLKRVFPGKCPICPG